MELRAFSGCIDLMSIVFLSSEERQVVCLNWKEMKWIDFTISVEIS